MKNVPKNLRLEVSPEELREHLERTKRIEEKLIRFGNLCGHFPDNTKMVESNAGVDKVMSREEADSAMRSAIDGKPLSEGEVSLIKALRLSGKIIDVYDYMTTVLVSANDNDPGVYTHRQHIAFFTSASDSDDEAIIRALKQIKAEREVTK
jgi:hypothetical protein